MSHPLKNLARGAGTGELVRAAQNSWPAILLDLGVGAEFLVNRHGPCPGCGGKDRFRFDDRDGRGTWVCGGGGDMRNGDGFDLLQHVLGWSQREAFEAVSGWLGLAGNTPLPPRPQRPLAPTIPIKPSTAKYALSLWAGAERTNKAVGTHPYSIKKGITWAAGAGRGVASGSVVGRDSDCLLIPIRAIPTDEVIAVQAINAAGQKQTFGPVKGHAFICGNTLNKAGRWFVVEGWADAISLVFHAHRGNAAAFAAMGHNFDAVTEAVVEHYAPDSVVVLEDAR